MTLPTPGNTETPDTDTSVCSTCGEPSSFVDNRPGANPVGYCAMHLPTDLQLAAASGHLQVSDEGLQPQGDAELPELSAEDETQLDAEAAAERVDKAARRR